MVQSNHRARNCQTLFVVFTLWAFFLSGCQPKPLVSKVKPPTKTEAETPVPSGDTETEPEKPSETPEENTPVPEIPSEDEVTPEPPSDEEITPEEPKPEDPVDPGDGEVTPEEPKPEDPVVPGDGETEPTEGEKAENEKVDATRLTPAELLEKAYDESRLLVLAESNHMNYRVWENLFALLEKVGKDPNLKYIVVENPHNLDAGLEELVTLPQMPEQLMGEVKDHVEHICEDNIKQPAYVIGKLLPKIQEINQRRPPNNPLRIKPVESLVDRFECGQEDCLAEKIKASMSHDRQIAINKTFQDKVWSQMGEQGKAIVVYHFTHVIKGFNSKMLKKNSEGKWKPEKGPMGWFYRFLLDQPEVEAQSRVILFDEVLSKDFEKNFRGELNLNLRQAKRFPEENFALDLKLLEPVLGEKGVEAFSKKSHFHTHLRTFQKLDRVEMNQSVSSMFDGVIWNHDAHLTSAYAEAKSYLPKYCGEQTNPDEMSEREKEAEEFKEKNPSHFYSRYTAVVQVREEGTPDSSKAVIPMAISFNPETLSYSFAYISNVWGERGELIQENDLPMDLVTSSADVWMFPFRSTGVFTINNAEFFYRFDYLGKGYSGGIGTLNGESLAYIHETAEEADQSFQRLIKMIEQLK